MKIIMIITFFETMQMKDCKWQIELDKRFKQILWTLMIILSPLKVFNRILKSQRHSIANNTQKSTNNMYNNT